MFDVTHIIQSGGLLLIVAIIFAESGMLLGFFMPGDTLLLSAGVFAAQGKLPLATTIALVALAAIVGDNTGYHIGRRLGPRLFKKKDGFLFRQEYVEQSEAFFKRFGSKTMLLAHFVPIVRTFAPIVAGVGKMDRKLFFAFDAIGDIAWAALVTLIGFWFGTKIPNIDHYILFAVALAMIFTFSPLAYHVIKAYFERRKVQSASSTLNED